MPAIDIIASDVGIIETKGNFFICLIVWIDILCNRVNKVALRIPYRMK